MEVATMLSSSAKPNDH
ncbi:hypothetical protein Goklo_022285 [Gossypium klotzschianum]|uniref:Uncharacterized protein n=1 Tax=Gossypium klotzschianum TaxID=34286 RepID=A0A7J8TM89_9ROSI|nr:hypothetical protein [Gossypium klotzschianum]